MTGRILVATLLLIGLCKTVAAAEPPVQTSKNAHKVLVVLAAVGVDNNEVKNLVKEVDQRVDNHYFTLSEQRVANGTLTLHYHLDGKVNIDHVELQFAPDNSNFLYTARTDAVMVNYNFKF